MNRVITAILFCLGLSMPSLAAQEPDLSQMSNDQIIAVAPDLHPSALYVLASRLLAEGEGQEAANWMYAGQLRYRILITAADEADRQEELVLFNALTEQVGRPVNEYIAGDVDEWIAAIDFALEWDETHPNSLAGAGQPAADEVRAGLIQFRDSLDGQREVIAREREENGLENR